MVIIDILLNIYQSKFRFVVNWVLNRNELNRYRVTDYRLNGNKRGLILNKWALNGVLNNIKYSNNWIINYVLMAVWWMRVDNGSQLSSILAF